MRPPLVVTIPHSARLAHTSRRAPGRGRIREEEISAISFESATAATVVYSRCHPFIWMLLMLMAVTLHRQYVDLFLEEDSINKYPSLAREDHTQRKATDQGSEGIGADLSSLVMSLIQSEVQPSFESQQTNLRRVSQPTDPLSESQEETSSERSTPSDESRIFIQEEIVQTPAEETNAMENKTASLTSSPQDAQPYTTTSKTDGEMTDSKGHSSHSTNMATSAPLELGEAH